MVSTVANKDAFKGLYYQTDLTDNDLPMIHCYSFSKDSDLVQDTINKTESIVGEISKNSLKVHKVRNVSPGKEMMCISFQLPSKFAFSTPSRPGKRKLDLN